ncbi:polysaccharide pyruvyl transferase family protein [Akkermansiaceae bacterium]|nr:polysaccharide pyruvyl transferase family protein [Akkermansiaceae bacterium]
MNKLLLYPHGGSGNHGCEAIVRTTMAILEGVTDSNTLFSDRPESDRIAGIDRLVTVTEAQVPLTRWQRLAAAISHKVTNTDEQFYRYQHAPMIKQADRNTIALCIGGDNYCYEWVDYLYGLNKFLRGKKARTVLWGCSVEPSAMDKVMVDDLRRHSVITARETITLEAMQEKGLENVKLYPDPAFQLETKSLKLPDGFEARNTVGINLSPLIMKYEKESGMAMKAYKALIQHIIETTDMQVALIPHVIVKGNSDLDPMTELYEAFKETGRIVLIGDHNAMELKGFIARCRIFIGARTHATIAAYSSCVPTLVVGYSVKARGIARDLFGSEEGMVMPVQNLTSTTQLVDAFEDLKARELEDQAHLEKVIPAYSSKASDAKDVIVELINGK